MTGKIHNFDLRVGGGYQMSLFYPSTATENRGKTADKEDRYSATYVELIPGKKIVQAITFHSNNAAFGGEMLMEVTFQPIGNYTRVAISFNNIPMGIRPEDNEAGTISTLEKLAAFVKQTEKI